MEDKQRSQLCHVYSLINLSENNKILRFDKIKPLFYSWGYWDSMMWSNFLETWELICSRFQTQVTRLSQFQNIWRYFPFTSLEINEAKFCCLLSNSPSFLSPTQLPPPGAHIHVSTLFSTSLLGTEIGTM